MNEKVQEEEEEEQGPWEEVIKRRRWKISPQCNALPDLVLLNIFCKSELKDRLQSIPLVCKSWKHVTDDPRCFSSMIPDSVSPEDAFIKNTSGYEFESYKIKLKLKSLFVVRYNNQYYYNQYKDYKVEDEFEEDKEFRVGISRRLRTLIKKSGGGAAITTLYLSPFSTYPYGCYQWFVEWQFEKILRLIANCCPNLKHISFEPFRLAPTEALLQLFNKCKKLELVDLSYYGYGDDDDENESLVIQEMGKCLPNLRGIRIGGFRPGPATSLSIATYLPQLKLLSLSSNFLYGEHLSVILFSCLKLQYVYIEGHRYQLNHGGQDIVDKVSAQITEFYFGGYDYDDYSEGSLESMEDMLECKETDIGYDYCYISKQRKEDQYVCILKKDENVSMLKKKIKYYHILKKKQEKDHQCNSRLKKKKKKCQYDSTLRRKKKDQCDYADYVIH